MDSNNNSDNRRIAKNTVYLYARMVLMILISLYTSRVVLRALGVEDFGLYNVIGGVVVLFSFINNAMTNASQRFLSFALGKRDTALLKKTFSMSRNCHVLIAIFVIIVSETIGLWFVNNKLVIPVGRESAVIWVYQLTIAVFVFSVLRVPYNAILTSYERFSFFAYITIFDAACKLAVAFAIVYTPGDKLIIYSLLLVVVAILYNVIIWTYCRRSFKVTSDYSFFWDRTMFKEMFNFTGWSMVSGCANVTSQQGGNILVNLFSGVVANASYGIANQVSQIVNGFVGNFQMAFQPQIVKLYASDSKEELYRLIHRSSSFSFYLLLIIALPLIDQTSYVLDLWLGEVPSFSVDFCRLLLLFYLIDAIQAPLWMLIYGSGDVKVYTLFTGAITFLNIPISYLLLKIGSSVIIIFVVRICLSLLCSFYRCFYVTKYLCFPISTYLKRVVIKALLVFSLSIGLIIFGNLMLKDMVHPLVFILFDITWTVVIAWFIGVDKNDRRILVNWFTSKKVRKV